MIALLLALGLAWAADTVAMPGPSRVVRVQVADLNGQPAAHRNVDLIGLERWGMEPYYDQVVDPAWHFTTDRDGKVSVPIGDFAGWEKSETRPGWGVYALTVRPGPNDAGAVSSRFWFDNCPTHNRDPRKDNWAPEYGPILYLPPDGLSLKVAIQNGFTLEGRVVDDQNPAIPLPNVDVRTNNDLHADTHTGYGGEIFGGYAKTDANGHFVLQHQFPQPLTVAISASWLRTKVAGAWVDDVLDSVAAPEDGQSVHLEIGAAAQPRFRYFGRVTDPSGKPIAGAQITIRLSRHPTLQSFEDDHGGANGGLTKTDGTYDYLAETPWVWDVLAFTPEGRHAGTGHAGDNLLKPGKYDLVLAPK